MSREVQVENIKALKKPENLGRLSQEGQLEYMLKLMEAQLWSNDTVFQRMGSKVEPDEFELAILWYTEDCREPALERDCQELRRELKSFREEVESLR
jgi:hypothetical protein